jgi:cell division transport system ATP-binding protein
VVRFEKVGLRYGVGPEVLRDLTFRVDPHSFQFLKEEQSYHEEVVELLKWVGLGDRIWALPPVLSGGEKQRAAIARAVIARPQLLLADEPTGNVDPNLAQRLLRLFIELHKSGTSVIIATHDIALMDRFDARRLVLHEGRLHVYE